MGTRLAIGVAVCLLLFCVAIVAVGPKIIARQAAGAANRPDAPKPRDSDPSGSSPSSGTATDRPLPRGESVGTRRVETPDDRTLAELPATDTPGDRKQTMLYRPVASAGGRFDAMGYSVAIAGVEGPALEQTCLFQGRSWACGMQARTEFRALLRGRALSCAVPPEPGGEIVTSACSLGRQDVGAWLVAQGWGKAAAGSAYADEDEEARGAKRGIYGPPPRLN